MEAQHIFLGIEGGATRSTGALIDGGGKVLGRAEGEACNLALLSDARVLRIWGDYRKRLTAKEEPTAVGIFLAGNYRPVDAARVVRLGKRVWTHSKIVTGNDGESAMAAGLGGD